MTLNEFNQLEKNDAAIALQKCCGSSRWVERMLLQVPFKSKEALMQIANDSWFEDCVEADYLEAFTHHPKIGDIESLAKKFANTKAWAGNEQAGVNTASTDVLEALAKGNDDYEKKFGYIFIVCATGKSAKEMLNLLLERLPNNADDEIKIAMQEQHKITNIRLNKLLDI